MRLPFVFLLGTVAALGCSSTSPATSGADAAVLDASPELDAGPDTAENGPDPRLIGRAPFEVHVPKGYDAAKPSALLLAFHGYGGGDNGPLLGRYFKLAALSETLNFLWVTPNGNKDAADERFWNGTNACCDYDGTNPDDVGYVRAIVADVAKRYTVDPKRVFAVGLSGGGFFVHRLACDAPDLFAAVISVAGATYDDDSKCKPKEGISVVEVHSDADRSVWYDGAVFPSNGQKYPSAKETVAHWAFHNGCPGALVSGGADLDLVSTIRGSETTVQQYQGCTKGAVELWTMKGAEHAPGLAEGFGPALWRFFEAHPKK